MTDPRRVGVLGAGTMGAGIAQVVAQAGLEVVMLDPVDGAYERARDRIGGFLERKVARGDLLAGEADATMARITEAGSIADLAAVDVVIEAIPEDLALKQDAFRRLDAVAPPATVLATNTSSLSVARIAEATTRPERVVGMHFFNPVPVMALVEVVAAAQTARPAVDATMALARQLGKTPVEAADTPGFIVNRVARPFYLESLRILESGSADAPAIDDALRGAGFRMGPFELVDVIGLDVNLAVSESVWQAFGRNPRYRPSPIQRVLVGAGRMGRKSDGGFYDYGPDGSRGAPWEGLAAAGGSAEPLDRAGIQDRILATIVNEAASAVEDRTATPESIDAAMTLGVNWPSGPLAWGERMGLTDAVAILDGLAASAADDRYAVVAILRSLAERGGSFFG